MLKRRYLGFAVAAALLAGCDLLPEGLRVGEGNPAYQVDPTAGDFLVLELSTGQTFTANHLPGLLADPVYRTTHMVLRRVEAGSFVMGSESGYADEAPLRAVTISQPFYLGVFEVTQRQWAQVKGTWPSAFVGEMRPVECVSWHDAHAFAWSIATSSGRDFRLPTEAEWEYAARAGKSGSYSYGSIPSKEHMWYSADYLGTLDAGSLWPSPWGFFDMHGNVAEWCADWFGADYYFHAPGVDPEGPESGSMRVLRGGAWSMSAVSCRSSARGRYTPGAKRSDFGLRIAMSAAQPGPPVIVSQPADRTVNEGEDAVFTVLAAGEPPLIYEWLFSPGVGMPWEPVPGAKAVDFTALSVQASLADDGMRFHCVVTNAHGSAVSDSVTLTVIPAGPPPAPTGLSVEPLSDSRMLVSWFRGSSNESGFRVERSPDGVIWTEIASVGAGVQAYEDVGLVGATVYWYRVRAWTAWGYSEYSAPEQSTTLDAPPDSSLVAHWRLDDAAGIMAGDSTGNGHEGSLLGGGFVWTAGRHGGALEFGNARFVEAPHSPDLELTGSMTISMWVKPAFIDGLTGVDAAMTFISKRSSNIPQPYEFKMRNGGVLIFEAFYPGVSNWLGLASEPGALAAGVWQHIAATRSVEGSAVQVRIYVNGVEVGQDGGNWAAAAANGNPVWMGRDGYHISYTNTTYVGGMDDVRLYNRALTAAEVALLAGLVPPPAAPNGLIATGVSRSRIDLTWTDNSHDETGFVIERSPNGSDGWVEIGSVGTDITSWSDAGLPESASFWYRVKAWNAGGSSEWSNTASASTMDAPVLSQYLAVDLSSGESVGYETVPALTTSGDWKTSHMVFRLIPAGSYLMGDHFGEGLPGEQPVHWVNIRRPFYLGVFPVTQAQLTAIMGSWAFSFPGNPLHPAEAVSWNDISLGGGFISSMNSLPLRPGDLIFRLPTEAEWEYAARAGTYTRFSYGDNPDGMFMWYLDNSGGGTREVGTRSPNVFGLYDVHGNVWEWVQDWFDGNYYQYCVDQQIENDPPGPPFGLQRVVRGGAWGTMPSECRSARRFILDPVQRNSNVGFRVAISVDG